MRTHAYAYAYFLPRGLKIDDVSRLNPAESVPILRYYDISLKKASGSGIERPVFIEQMESLKEQGFTTINLKQYDQFLNNEFLFLWF